MSQPRVDPFAQVRDKDEHKTQIAKAIELKMGRPPVNAIERRKRAGVTDIMAGDPIAIVERKYALAGIELQQYMKQVFPTDEEKFEFIENCLLRNAALAGARFVQTYNDLSADQAATAMVKFATAATTIKKGRESGFKEPPMNVGIILSLQKTLENLTTLQPPAIDI